jgi:ABC-type branched-subunit amino acid transport system substrate-binding protein
VTPCGGNAGQLNRLVFCVGLDPSERGRLLAKYAAEEGKVADITLVTSSAHAIYRATPEGFEREYRHADRKIGHDFVYRDRKELDDVVARLGRGKPPVILFSGPVADLVVLRAGLKEVPVYFGGEDDESAMRLDADLCEGVIFASAFSVESTRPRVQEFVGKLRSRTKQQMVDAGDALSADAARILFDAAKKANSFERDKLRAGLEGLENYECLTGPFWFTPEQTCRRIAYVLQFKAGQPKLLKEYPPEKK